MPTLSEIFDKRKITLYHNESLDLDHYYQEPYQDEDDEIKEMGIPFETDQSKKKRSLDLSNEDRTYSGFSFFHFFSNSILKSSISLSCFSTNSVINCWAPFSFSILPFSYSFFKELIWLSRTSNNFWCSKFSWLFNSFLLFSFIIIFISFILFSSFWTSEYFWSFSSSFCFSISKFLFKLNHKY